MKIRTRYLLFCLILFLPEVTQAESDFFTTREMQTIVDEIQIETGVVALAAGIVETDGLSVIAVSGLRRRGSDALVTSSDRWHIASCTKAMTSVLVAQFVERGLLSWGAKIPQLFPQWDEEMDSSWRDVTLEHLLSHRAGLEDVGARWWIGGRLSMRSAPEQRSATARRLLRRRPAKPVGEFSYSNLGYMIVAAVLESIDPKHRSWEQMMRDDIFEPLKASDGFGFGPPLGSDQPEGHKENLFGFLRPVGQGDYADNPSSFGPAGTVHASFPAWGQFIAFMLGGGESALISDANRAYLTTPLFEGEYALGWYVEEHPLLGSIWRHPGSNRMWRSLHVIVPGENFGILVATNQGDEVSKRAIKEVAERVLALHVSR